MSNSYVQNKNILLTGASSGIGLALLKKLSMYDTNIFAFARNLERLDRNISNIVSPKAKIFASYIDLQKPDTIKKYFENIFFSMDYTPDILVNNAGFFSAAKFANSSLSDFDQIINTNLRGTFFLTQFVLKKMLEKSSGIIINIASVTANKAFPNCSIYAASKAGLLAMMRSLREEVRNSGIKVINISPGATATEIWDEKTLQKKRNLMSKAEDIASIVISSLELCKLEATIVEEIVVRPQNGDF